MRNHVDGRVLHFDRIASTYDERFGQGVDIMHQALAAELDRYALEPEVVLDVGCGTGTLLALLANRFPGAHLLGVDPSPAMIQIARTKVPGAQFMEAMAEALDVADDTVDLVVSTTSFGQWGDQAAGLRQIARVLQPSGLAIVIEHTPSPLWKRILRRSAHFVAAGAMARMVDESDLVMCHQRMIGERLLVSVCARSH